MNLSVFNNIRLEYSMGATVLIISLIDTSVDGSVLTADRVTKIIIEYSNNGNDVTLEFGLNFHINSDLIFITDLEPDSDISFTPYIVYENYGEVEYKIQLTGTIEEHTLPYGNIDYDVVPSGYDDKDDIIRDKMSNILRFINDLGAYVDTTYDDYAQYAQQIPVKYNELIQTASAYYYRSQNENKYGLVETSGGQYFKNDVMFHELRHRYGIVQSGTHIKRAYEGELEEGEHSALFNYISDDYTVIHDAIKFETGRLDAKCWIFMAHSNIPEGEYTNDNWYFNYLAANYIKALIWYTSHDVNEPDLSKVRVVATLDLIEIEGDIDNDIEYNINLNIIGSGSATLNQTTAHKDDVINITVTPDRGYKIGYVRIIGLRTGDIEKTYNSTDSTFEYSFIMPGEHITVYILFIEDENYNNDDDYVDIDKLDTNVNINTKFKTINLGSYQYLYEYLKNGEDFDDIGCSDQYVILRNFEIINDIIYDKDIFFIEKSIYNKLIHNIGDNLICYPLYKNGSLFFSDTYGYFVKYNISLKDISYNIYDEDENQNEIEANILCDKLRIYNPIIKKNLDFIVYVDNYINNIHFHYFCNLNKNFNKKYTGEIKINNDRYIEYIEINIPNIKKLFSDTNKFFIKEDFNKIATNEDFTLNDYFENMNNQNKVYNEKLYLSKIIKPFIIDKVENNDKTTYIKTFIDDKYFNYNSNFVNTSLNITIYPYTGISNNIYLANETITSSSTFITYENYFRLSSRLGFDNGIISLINEFIYPNKVKSKKNKDTELDKQITEEYNTFFLHENLSDEDNFREDFNDELDVEAIRSTGFVIQIATDSNFKEIILESVINTDNDNDNFIYDFSFSLNEMVDNWSQLNDILIIRAKFIDKRLNNVIIGNNVVITKEWFKYFINDTHDYIIKFDNTNNLIKNMNTTYFNFIDHINCTITENNDTVNTNVSNNITNTKLIYKPIFYKVQDLQNISLRQGMTQKIGINLTNFVTKVNCFILNIGNESIKESYRNDIYVIFEVNANNIEESTGYYNILNDDFEYISSGNYTKY